jgi:hypothetical protein
MASQNHAGHNNGGVWCSLTKKLIDSKIEIEFVDVLYKWDDIKVC